MTEPKIIKRYANRKLYDTERSCYVTLDEIAEMIKEGEELRVIDNKSKEDLTAVTFAQIIFEQEKKVARMPLMLLRSIIQNSGDVIGGFLQRRVGDPVLNLRGDVERRVENLFSKQDDGEGLDMDAEDRAEAAAHDTRVDANGAPEQGANAGELGERAQTELDEAEANAVRAFVHATTEAFENWQRRIDDQVHKALSAMTHLTHVGADVDVLRARLHRLEDRLNRIENRQRQNER